MLTCPSGALEASQYIELSDRKFVIGIKEIPTIVLGRCYSVELNDEQMMTFRKDVAEVVVFAVWTISTVNL